MNTISHYVMPRLNEVAVLLGQDSRRADFGGTDIPTLISLIFLFILYHEGNRAQIIAYIERVSLFTESQVMFVLDQYRGKHPDHHLWKRDWKGRYLLNLPR